MKSKRFFTIFCILALYCMNANSINREDSINLQYKGNHGIHSGQPLFPADQPSVYYNDVTQQIIIDGTGEATYYDVEITSMSTFDMVLSTQVNGNYDTINVSSLPDDNYEIVITSSLNNEYLGYFTNY